MIFDAASRSFALRSFILTSAISRSCERLIVPALVLFGSAEPDLIFAAFFRRKEAGGVLGVKGKLRGAETVRTVGIGAPFSSSCVEALNALQNSMMLTPRWPSAGPIGGAGFAMPAGTCSLI